MINVLFDVQTLFTADKNRGIGKAVSLWMEALSRRAEFINVYLLSKNGQYWRVRSTSSDEDSWEEFESLNVAVYRYNIDVVHLTSPLMFDIFLPDLPLSCALAISVHDLIPLSMRHIYLDQWAKELVEEYKKRLTFITKASILLPNSQTTQRDISQFIPHYRGPMTVVPIPIKPSPSPRLKGHDRILDEKYVLAVVGEDTRKNTEGLIEAFDTLEDKSLRLVLIGLRDEAYRNRIRKHAQKFDVLDRVDFLGYVSEDELATYYENCEVVCIPSLYEGFGIPAIEAMEHRKWVVAFDNSAIPEVAGNAGIYAEELTTQSLAKALSKALKYEGDYPDISERLQRFSIDNVADALLHAYKACVNPKAESSDPLQVWTPVPPQVTGIADYNEMFTPYLRKYFEPEIVGVQNGATKPRVYHMGNNTLHQWIFEEMGRNPGITVLHDGNMWGFFTWAYFHSGDIDSFRRYLAEEVSDSTRRDELIDALYNKTTINDPPLMIQPILNRSLHVVVHNEYVWSTVKRRSVNSVIIPHPAAMGDNSYPDYNTTNHEIVIPGGIWPNKRIEVTIRAFAKLVDVMPTVKLTIVGTGDEHYRDELVQLGKELHVNNKIVFTGYADKSAYKEAILNASVVVCLRYPTMGETSGAVIDAMKAGKPIIVNDVGSYSEYPDDVVWKLPLSPIEDELLASYLIEILNNPRVALGLGMNSKKFLCDRNSAEKVAWRYYEVIRQSKPPQ